MNGLDLFSGIGGIALALVPWVKPRAYCEIDKYAQSVLLSNMSDGKIPIAPIWDDVRTLAGRYLPSIDIITGGFPCQDISLAGDGAGLAGERSGLFWEVVRLAGDLRPSFVFLENVPAITSRGGIDVVGAFTQLGYDCRWCVISAASVGAPHIRKRWFLLAHAQHGRFKRWNQKGERAKTALSRSKKISDTFSQRLSTRRLAINAKESEGFNAINRNDWWAIEPDLGRVVNGIPFRVDRIKGLGNAVVPVQAKKAFEILTGLNY